MPTDASLEMSPQKPSRPVALFMALAFFVIGAAILAAAAGALPAQPTAHDETPRWVVGCIGFAFIAGSLVPINATFGLPSWVNRLVALTVGLGLAMVFNWIAFFPGERHFSTTVSLPGVSFSGAGSALTGRIVFGLGALLADWLVLYGIWHELRSARTPHEPAPEGGETR